MWSEFADQDLTLRPRPDDPRGRNQLEHMVHQSVSENLWFESMLGISVTENPLPAEETRMGFIRHYAGNAGKRLQGLRSKPDSWWEEEVDFFEVKRSRAWIMTRRIAHTAHHRGQQTALARWCGYALHSTYGPTADTGGLMQNRAPVVYAYPDLETLLREESSARKKASLPGPGGKPSTERPG